MYADWHSVHNLTHGSDDFVDCDLENSVRVSVQSLISQMCKFITEIRKLDDIDFPAKTLCVQFHLEKNGIMWRLLDDEQFTELKFTLDNVMRQCTSTGIGISVKKADIISKTDEDILWSKGILGSENP